ncbi:hypothetical protein MRB53_014480 [Persea americana]|uniref:Uncharacterized protein n=1 Tax=Persea americana TaxID=3435 RepID=A0ACC2KAX1_PERAE|nr:hypothetical protein MRB53_014480 [Persea americana]
MGLQIHLQSLQSQFSLESLSAAIVNLTFFCVFCAWPYPLVYFPIYYSKPNLRSREREGEKKAIEDEKAFPELACQTPIEEEVEVRFLTVEATIASGRNRASFEIADDGTFPIGEW